MAKRNVTIFGFGLFQQIGGGGKPFKVGYRFSVTSQLQASKDSLDRILDNLKEQNEIVEAFVEEVTPPTKQEEYTNHFFMHKFTKPAHKDGIKLKAGEYLNFAYWCQYDEGPSHTFCVRNDVLGPKDQSDFQVFASPLSKNGTDVESGLLPALLY